MSETSRYPSASAFQWPLQGLSLCTVIYVRAGGQRLAQGGVNWGVSAWLAALAEALLAGVVACPDDLGALGRQSHCPVWGSLRV